MQTIRERIVDIYKNHPADQYTNAGLAEHLGVPQPSIRRETAQLVAEGTLTKTSSAPYYFKLNASEPTKVTGPAVSKALPLPRKQKMLVAGVRYMLPDGRLVEAMQGPNLTRLNSFGGAAKKSAIQMDPEQAPDTCFSEMLGNSACIYLQLV
jgi:hypothetical protein